MLNIIKVTGLSSLARKSVLEMIFTKYGSIKSVVLSAERHKALIEFNEAESCFKALSKFETDEDFTMILDDAQSISDDFVTIATKQDMKEFTSNTSQRKDSNSQVSMVSLIENLSTSDSQKDRINHGSTYTMSKSNSKENLIKNSSFFSDKQEENKNELDSLINEFSQLSLLSP